MSVFTRLALISKPHRGTLVSSLGLLLLSVLFELTETGCYALLLSLVILGAPITDASTHHIPIKQLPEFLANIITLRGTVTVLIYVCIGTVAVKFIKCIIDARQGYLSNKFATLMAREMRQRLFSHILRLSPAYFEHEKTGSQISRITSDVVLLQQALGQSLSDAVRAPFTIFMSLVIMFGISWKLTLLALCLAPIIAILIGIAGRIIRRLSIQLQDRLAEFNGSLVERISNIRVIQSFVREPHENATVGELNQRYYRAALRSLLVTETVSPTIELIATVGMVIGVLIGGLAVLHGDINAAAFALFIGLAQKAGSQFKALSRLNQTREQAEGTGFRIFELLDTVPEIKDLPDAQVLPDLQGQITFDHVNFSYASGDAVLYDIHFAAAPGEVIALVGQSGSGKTTLVNLLPRFYDPTGGRILVDGKDIRTVTLASLRAHVGSVPQETALFSGTIYENILYGRLDASEAEVIEAARSANALEFIERLPEQFQTVVGERGARLSGGQRQRVAIARALLKNPRILILDEATSALDTESEFLVQQALERLMQDRTTFVIAHRLSTVQHATRILVLDRGRIVEVGAHQELLARGGIYQRLYEKQFRTETADELVEALSGSTALL